MPTRLAVLTDAHANLPALEAALAAIRSEGVTAIYHTGDAIGIGPFPAEVLDRLLHTPGARPVMGNHDAWFAYGLPTPRPVWMSEGELAHQRWTHAQIDPDRRPEVAAWPWVIEEEVAGVPVVFVHYALDASGHGFATPVPHPSPADLDRLFAPRPARLLRPPALPRPGHAGGRRPGEVRQPGGARLRAGAPRSLRPAHGRRRRGARRVPGRPL